MWVYEGTLKLEHQAVTLSKYRVELLEDRRHIKAVSNPRIAETIFRSPQMTLFDLGPDEWLLYWKAPPYSPRRRPPPGSKLTQLALFEMPNGGEGGWGRNRLSIPPPVGGRAAARR